MPKLTKSPLSKIATDKHPETLIRAYGEFWIRNEVDWKEKRLMGQRRHFRGTTKERVFNAWQQKGIYALHNNFKIVYVGHADDRGLGQRLLEHCHDRLRERWDTFSWYGICQISHDGRQTPYKPVACRSLL